MLWISFKGLWSRKRNNQLHPCYLEKNYRGLARFSFFLLKDVHCMLCIVGLRGHGNECTWQQVIVNLFSSTHSLGALNGALRLPWLTDSQAQCPAVLVLWGFAPEREVWFTQAALTFCVNEAVVRMHLGGWKLLLHLADIFGMDVIKQALPYQLHLKHKQALSVNAQ